LDLSARLNSLVKKLIVRENSTISCQG